VRAQRVFTFARKAVRLTGDETACRQVDETLARRHVKITEIMDMLWTIQEIVFDLMLPWRTELPEDVEMDDDEPGAGGVAPLQPRRLERRPGPPIAASARPRARPRTSVRSLACSSPPCSERPGRHSTVS